jgi:Holliday junction resolvase RusA-like endonuclease
MFDIVITYYINQAKYQEVEQNKPHIYVQKQTKKYHIYIAAIKNKQISSIKINIKWYFT